MLYVVCRVLELLCRVALAHGKQGVSRSDIDALYRTNYHLWPVSLHSMTRLTVWVFYELIRFKIQNFPSPSCNMLLCPICSMGSMAAHICIYDSYLLILWHVYSINYNIWPSMTLYYCLLWPICLWLLFAFFVGFYAEEILFPARASSLLFLSVMFFSFKILILASYASIYRILCSRRTRWRMKTMRTRYRQRSTLRSSL